MRAVSSQVQASGTQGAIGHSIHRQSVRSADQITDEKEIRRWHGFIALKA
jgi:hypothetical protein